MSDEYETKRTHHRHHHHHHHRHKRLKHRHRPDDSEDEPHAFRKYESEESSNDESAYEHKKHQLDESNAEYDRHKKHRSRSREKEKEKDKSKEEKTRKEEKHRSRESERSAQEGMETAREKDKDKSKDKHKEKEKKKKESHRKERSRWENDDENHERTTQIKQEAGAAQLPPDSNLRKFEEKSGKLAEDTNMFNGVVVKYSEPQEARKPKRRWRLYPFKGSESLPVLHIHRQSAFLLGRERRVCDIPIDHPSCSKQHAALQYRLVPYTREDGRRSQRVRLYIIDLESANGTFVNNNKIEAKKYVELLEKDVIKFGFSSREYVLLHEHSKDSEDDDDI